MRWSTRGEPAPPYQGHGCRQSQCPDQRRSHCPRQRHCQRQCHCPGNRRRWAPGCAAWRAQRGSRQHIPPMAVAATAPPCSGGSLAGARLATYSGCRSREELHFRKSFPKLTRRRSWRRNRRNLPAVSGRVTTLGATRRRCLRAYQRPAPPARGGRCWHAVDSVECGQRARSTHACLSRDCDGTCCLANVASIRASRYRIKRLTRIHARIEPKGRMRMSWPPRHHTTLHTLSTHGGVRRGGPPQDGPRVHARGFGAPHGGAFWGRAGWRRNHFWKGERTRRLCDSWGGAKQC